MSDTPDAPAAEPPAADPDREHRIAERITFGNLCSELCNAVGVDPETNQGFTLTVLGGDVPQLVVYALPPAGPDGDPRPDWVDGLADIRSRGLSYAVLPGQNMRAPEARDRGQTFPPGHPGHHDSEVAQIGRA